MGILNNSELFLGIFPKTTKTIPGGASIVAIIMIIYGFHIARQTSLKDALLDRNRIREKKTIRNELAKELTEEERKAIKSEIDSARFSSQMAKPFVGFHILMMVIAFYVGVVELLKEGLSISILWWVLLVLVCGGFSIAGASFISKSEKEIEEKEKILERKYKEKEKC